MKKILLSFLVLASLVWSSKINAQACTLNNLVVNLNSATPATVNGVSGCQVNMKFEFDIANNSGNKYTWINIWKSTDYNFVTPNPYTKKAPTLDELDGADNTHDPVAVIGLDYLVDGDPLKYFTSYYDNAITPVTSPTAPTNVNGHFVLENLSFFIPGGCADLVLQGDVWSSQSSSNPPVIACYTRGISFFGDPTIAGFVNCGLHRQFNIGINTVSTGAFTVNYKVYIDKGTLGTKDASDDLIYSSGNVSTSAGSPYSSGPIPYTDNDGNPLLVELNVVAPFTKTIYGVIPPSECIPLPVAFKSFNASRSNSSNVSIAWTTASEQNNKGFNVQKNVNGEWKTIAFVFSQAPGGTSTSDLSYSYNDPNMEKGISQYRVQQVDLDGKFTYSEIRAIRGEGSVGKIVIYPNPSTDGKVNVVFEDNSAVRDVIVNDMQGRIVQSFKGITNNILVISKLTSGFYTIKVTNRTTAASSVQKVIIK